MKSKNVQRKHYQTKIRIFSIVLFLIKAFCFSLILVLIESQIKTIYKEFVSRYSFNSVALTYEHEIG